MIQILRQLTKEKGGVYVHWDSLEAWSHRKSDAQAVVITFIQSHAHAARNHQAAVADAVFRLFVKTPDSVHLGVRPRGYLRICWDMIGYVRIS